MRHGYGVRVKKALLSGYFGYGNAGDDAILGGAIELLGEYGIKSLVAFNPRGDFSSFRARGAERVNRYSARAVGDALADCDALVFAGGNLFQNETSTRSLLYYSAICALAERARRPIYMLSSGIGKISGYLGRECARRALSRVCFAGLRTDGDIAEWSGALSCPTRNMPDLAFSVNSISGERSGFFAIVVSEGGEALRRDALRLKEEGLRPVVIPFFLDRDKEASYRLASELGCEVFVSQNTNEIISRLSTCRAVLTERLHGAVFSLLSATPCILRSRAEKCSHFANEVKKRAKKLDTPSPVFSDGEAFSSFGLSLDCDFAALLSDFKHDLLVSLDAAFGA